MKVYLAGPIRGRPNGDHFKEWRERLREWGYEVVCPVEIDEDMGLTWEDATNNSTPFKEFMARDLPRLLECEAIALIPGWVRSQGACLELTVAEECGLEVFYLDGEGIYDSHWFEVATVGERN